MASSLRQYGEGMGVKLSDLLEHIPGVLHVGGDTDITAPVVESDAEVEPGGVFVARRGLSTDGHDFIDRAIERGAAAIVGERPLINLAVPYIRVENAQEAVGFLAAAYHGYPSRRLIVVGVTGTDGKTTTSTLIHSVLRLACEGRAGLISTVAADLGDREVDTGLHVTTPGAPQIQALLAQMVANGLTHCVLEMTSHGLAQGRLNGVDVDVAVLTNVTHEHLDFHGSFDAYRAAKGRLFEMLTQSERKPGQDKVSVVNVDDPSAEYFAAIRADRVIRYGLSDKAELRATEITTLPWATEFAVTFGGDLAIETYGVPLVGRYNVLNALAAIGASRALGMDTIDIQQGIGSVLPIPGRMERIDAGQDFLAVVDFAHTPNALANALEAARSMAGSGGKLIVVFGSAGLRDRDKRRLMAETAARLADFIILTAEDPRTESLDAILQTMADATMAAGGVEGETFIRVPDRGEALYRACQRARSGDVVIACGKGHERSMAFGTVEYPWDDREALADAIRGEPPRTLPTAGS